MTFTLIHPEHFFLLNWYVLNNMRRWWLMHQSFSWWLPNVLWWWKGSFHEECFILCLRSCTWINKTVRATFYIYCLSIFNACFFQVWIFMTIFSSTFLVWRMVTLQQPFLPQLPDFLPVLNLLFYVSCQIVFSEICPLKFGCDFRFGVLGCDSH